MHSRIVLPRILQIGAGASSETGNILESIGCSRPLIVTDKMMVQLGYVNGIQACLPDCGIYADTVPEPTVASILAGAAKAQEGEYDSIIAIGGGSRNPLGCRTREPRSWKARPRQRLELCERP